MIFLDKFMISRFKIVSFIYNNSNVILQSFIINKYRFTNLTANFFESIIQYKIIIVFLHYSGCGVICVISKVSNTSLVSGMKIL